MKELEKQISSLLYSLAFDARFSSEKPDVELYIKRAIKLFTSQKNHSLQEQKEQLREKISVLKENRHKSMNAVAAAGARRTIDEILELLED